MSSTGLLTTLKQGNVTVTATLGAVSGSAPLTVGPPLPVSMSVSPATAVAIVGASQPTKISAVFTMTDHSTQDVSSQTGWSLGNPFVASVDSSGNLKGLIAGYTKLTATNSNFSATVNILVKEIPRYLYLGTNAGRVISRATIDSNTGQLRMEGNVITGANNLSFTCLSTDPAHKFLYVGAATSSGSSGELLIYSIDQTTGELTAITGSPFPVAAPINCVRFTPSGKFAYSTNSVNGATQLLAFSRDTATGTLTLTNTITLNGPPLDVAIDPLGQYLYAATIALSNTAQAYGFSIDPSTGSLTPVNGTPFPLTNITGVFSFHPTGNSVYMANSNGASIDVYTVNRATGALTLSESVATCVNPTAVRFSTTGQFAYTACSMDVNHDPNSGSVESFSMDTNGFLTHIGSAPAANGPFDLSIDPCSQFLYLSANASYLYSFNIGTDGIARAGRKNGVMPNQSMSLMVMGGSSQIQYNTNFAYISSTGDHQLTTFPVKTDGTFGVPPGPSTSTQSSPFSLSLLPWGSDLLLASAAANPSLTSYALSPATGLPGSAQNFGNATTSGAVAIDPTEKWAFQTDSAQNVVFTFGNLGGWGLLSYITGSGTIDSFATGPGPGPMLVDPSGRFVYVANQGSGANSISAYDYFGTSPELSEATGNIVLPYTDGSPFSIGAEPLGMAMDPGGLFLYVVAADQTLQVYAVDYFSGGHLAKLTSTSLGGQPAGVAAEPTGRFVYTADSVGIKAFSVDPSSGALSSITLTPAISLSNLAGVFVDPSGKFLYALTSTTGAGAVFVYTINSDGTLAASSSNPIATPDQPSSMAFSASIQ